MLFVYQLVDNLIEIIMWFTEFYVFSNYIINTCTRIKVYLEYLQCILILMNEFQYTIAEKIAAMNEFTVYLQSVRVKLKQFYK